MIKVYKYGLRPPTGNRQLVIDQMRAAHKYRNTLVEIERARRAKLREFLSAQPTLGPAEALVRAAEAELEAVLGEVRKERAATHRRSESQPQRDRIKAAREARKIAKDALRAARFAIRADKTAEAFRNQVEEEFAQKRRDARAACGTYWGSYLLIESADEAARKQPLYDGAEPNDPRFVPAAFASNMVGVQLQGGISCEEIFSPNETQIQVAPVDERAWNAPRWCERRRLSFTTLKLRVGSNPNRSPIWAEWPMQMHRALPEKSRIKAASVTLKRVGPKEYWHLNITVDMTNTPAVNIPARIDSAVAVDIGWRQIGDELRVASWGDQQGHAEELRLTDKQIYEIRRADELRATRESGFAKAHMELVGFVKAAKETLPDWLKLATETLPQWRSAGRLASLCLKWRDERKACSENNPGYKEPAHLAAAFDALEKWRFHDHHLWSWEAHQRRRSLGWRRDVYRCFAKRMAEGYSTLVLEEFDLRKIARRPATDQSPENETARSNRQLAAVSELRGALIQAFQSFGREVAFVSAVDTTRTCHECGSVEKFDAATILTPTCKNGHTWDQDVRAWHNLLDRWNAREPEAATEAKSTESRWARAKRMKAEKAEQAAE